MCYTNKIYHNTNGNYKFKQKLNNKNKKKYNETLQIKNYKVKMNNINLKRKYKITN